MTDVSSMFGPGKPTGYTWTEDDWREFVDPKASEVFNMINDGLEVQTMYDGRVWASVVVKNTALVYATSRKTVAWIPDRLWRYRKPGPVWMELTRPPVEYLAELIEERRRVQLLACGEWFDVCILGGILAYNDMFVHMSPGRRWRVEK